MQDSTTSDAIKITLVQRDGLRCILQSPRPLVPGTVVCQEVDFSRRWDHMQQHTGQHLLSAIMDTYRLYTLGWTLGPKDEMNYIEIPRKPSEEELREIQQKCNEVILSNLPITVETPTDAKSDSLPDDYDKDKGVVRVVHIGNLDSNTYVLALTLSPFSCLFEWLTDLAGAVARILRKLPIFLFFFCIILRPFALPIAVSFSLPATGPSRLLRHQLQACDPFPDSSHPNQRRPKSLTKSESLLNRSRI